MVFSITIAWRQVAFFKVCVFCFISQFVSVIHTRTLKIAARAGRCWLQYRFDGIYELLMPFPCLPALLLSENLHPEVFPKASVKPFLYVH